MSKEIKEHCKYFNTSDMGCSAALVCAGFDLASLDKANPRKVLFVFNKRVGIDDAAHNYWNGNLKVDAQGLFNAIKRLKNQIYSG
jgi:Domain of unknown function (DUF5659)